MGTYRYVYEQGSKLTLRSGANWRLMIIIITRNTCLAEPREIRGRVHHKKFSDWVGRGGISGLTGEVELHGHNLLFPVASI